MSQFKIMGFVVLIFQMSFFFGAPQVQAMSGWNATSPYPEDHTPVVTKDYFTEMVKPIFESRCVQCHSCYNSPCQLNLTSVEGLNRGLVKDFEVYSPRKLRKAEPSRLGIDRQSTDGWRNFSWRHRFQPVTIDHKDESLNRQDSLIYQLTQHKKKNASLIVDDLNNPKEQAESSRSCPVDAKELGQHLMDRPNAGMPYGLPALSDQEIAIIQEWTDRGSPRGQADRRADASDLGTLRRTEAFLNAYISESEIETAKRKSLVSRYLYEHLFIGNISFQESGRPQAHYRLIRTLRPCEDSLFHEHEFASRRPWDDPQEKFYYCFKRVDQTIMHKTHLPYTITDKKLLRWQQLFLSTNWKVRFLVHDGPWGYTWKKRTWAADVGPRDNERASNPFYVFQDIPVQARYQFLLDDAKFQIDTFIRGPVCKGNTAVNSIDEQFYVFFLRPESDLMVRNAEFHNRAIPNLILPARQGSEQVGGVVAGRKIRIARNHYRELRDHYLGIEFPQGQRIEDLWNGWGVSDQGYLAVPNGNAALTVFRNFDSAAVTQGLAGSTSKTIFVLDYSTLERLVYDLVPGFDVFGDVSHQLQTRIYMAYLRMEAEENFLTFMPPHVRRWMRASWYVPADGITERIGKVVNRALRRDLDKMSRRYPLLGLDRPTGLAMTDLQEDQLLTMNAKDQEELLRSYRRAFVQAAQKQIPQSIRQDQILHIDKRLAQRAPGNPFPPAANFAEFESQLAQLGDLRAEPNPWIAYMPSLSYIVVDSPAGSQIYTMIRNKEHLNIAWIAGEKDRRNHGADSLTFTRGVVGSYPNHFFRVGIDQAHAFLNTLKALGSHVDYERWVRTYGNPRDGIGSERFWPNSDHLHRVFRQQDPINFGVFDFNRYGIDYRFADDTQEDTSFFKDLNPEDKAAFDEAFSDNNGGGQ